MASLFDENDFLKLGLFIAGRRVVKSRKVSRGRFQSSFGTEPVVVADLWQLLMDCRLWTYRDKCKPSHLLWALMFLKTYGKEMDMAARVRCDEKTWRKWVWVVLHGISLLKSDVVSNIPDQHRPSTSMMESTMEITNKVTNLKPLCSYL